MRIVVAGGHGQIALRLLKLLAAAGHEAVGLVRSHHHVADLEAVGARGAVADLEGDEPLTDLLDPAHPADAVVFAAGAGPGSGPERKRTVDLGGAVRLIEACDATGVRRYVMVSSVGAHDPESASESMRAYQRAKAEADQALMGSALEWTIVRPGRLTDDPGDGRVRVSTDLG